MDQSLDKKTKAYFNDKLLLVTGASGYIATNLIDALKDVNCSIIRISRKDRLYPFDGKARVVDVQGDIRDEGIWRELIDGIDIIYHFAAQTSAYAAEEKPYVDFQANVMPMIRLLEVCRNKACKPTVIFSGTVTETGMTRIVPVNEDNEDDPITIYDLHKLMAEDYLKYFSKQGLVKGTVLRLPNVYGPGPESSSKDRGILNLMIKRALDETPLQIYGAGQQVRDYVYIDDVVRAFILAAGNIDKLNGQHFVIGSGAGYSISDALHLIAKRVQMKTGKSVAVNNVQPPANLSLIEDRDFVADTSRFVTRTGWQPEYTLYKGIDRTIDHLIQLEG